MTAVFLERAVGTIFSPSQGAPTPGTGRKAGARPGELAPAFSPPQKRWPVASGHCWACGPAVINTTACLLAAALLLPAAHSPSALGSRSARLQDRTRSHSHAILACDTSHDTPLLCEHYGASTRTSSNRHSGSLGIARSQGLLLALARIRLRTRASPRARLLANRGAPTRLRDRSRSRSQARARESERGAGATNDSRHPLPLGIPLVARDSLGMCCTQTHACLRPLSNPHDTLLPPRAPPQLDAG
jgi:hypothetical protein